MSKPQRIAFADLRVGQEITLQHHDGHGKGGTIVETNLPHEVRLISGTGRYDNTQILAHWDWATVEVAQPASDCINYDPDTCVGPVEPCCSPGGHASFDRCVFHNDLRWEQYESENSSERWADSDVAPPGFNGWGGTNEFGERFFEDA